MGDGGAGRVTRNCHQCHAAVPVYLDGNVWRYQVHRIANVPDGSRCGCSGDVAQVER